MGKSLNARIFRVLVNDLIQELNGFVKVFEENSINHYARDFVVAKLEEFTFILIHSPLPPEEVTLEDEPENGGRHDDSL